MNVRIRKNWKIIAIITLLLVMVLVIPVSAAYAPTVSSATTNTAGTVITITFNKTMADPDGKQDEFKYQINGGGDQSFSAAALNAGKIDLTTSGTPIAYGNTVTVSYTLGTVIAGDGGVLATFTGQAVTNNKAAGTAPTVSAAATNTAGNVITLTFTKPMASPTGKQGEFKYQINGGANQSFSAAALNADPTKIDLTTSGTPIAYGDTVTVSYTLGTVIAGDGGVLATFTGQAVTNNVPAAAPVAIFSGTPRSGPKPLTVVFRNESTGVVSSYAWNFGDGGTSNSPSPSHQYTTVGSYSVNLTVTGPGGSDFENKPNYITVTNATTKIGIYKDGVWNLDLYGNGGKGAGIDKSYLWGGAGYAPVVGDWNGDNKTEIGTMNAALGDWWLDYDGSGTWNSGDRNYHWGAPRYAPVVGDWNGDGKVKIGTYNPDLSIWYLDYNGDGAYTEGVNPAYTFRGETGWTPIVGDWNGNGMTKIGVYKDASSYLDFNGNGAWDAGTDNESYVSPQLETTPVIGDWNGDGKTKVGRYKEGIWYLDYYGNGNYSRYDSFYGAHVLSPQFTPVVGDWNGNKISEIGVYQNGNWYLDMNGNEIWDGTTTDRMVTDFGLTGWITVVVGDWNGDGKSKIGVYRATDGTWRLDYFGNGSYKDYNNFGPTGSIPVIGDWNGDGKSKIGVFNNGAWQLDYNGNGVWDGASTDKEYPFGATGWIPVVGKWS